MPCVECKEPSKYKCPTCKSPYCSVKCFSTHKASCKPKPAGPAKPAESGEDAKATPSNENYEAWLTDPQLVRLIEQDSLKHHLKLVANLVSDAKLSGESSSEGRRFVALKKLRELRMGGREQNESVEEFVQCVQRLGRADAPHA